MKIPAEVSAWYKRIGSKGGASRAKRLSKARLSEIARLGGLAKKKRRKAGLSDSD